MGTLIKGLGTTTCSGAPTSVWYGSPQWQIEAFRRLEIPEDMQKKHGFAPLGAADGPVKSAIFGYNGARLYKLDLRAELPPMPRRDREAEGRISRGWRRPAIPPMATLPAHLIQETIIPAPDREWVAA